MGNKTTSVGGGSQDDPATLRAQIAETRQEMSGTIEELHGRLNPAVLKEQAIDQFHEATATVKAELKAHFQEAKQALKDELKEAKAAIKSEVVEEIDAAKTRFSEEVTQAKAAMREATIGKVEDMVHDARDRVREVRRSVTETIKDNPIPAALAGLGLAWLFIEGRRSRANRDRGVQRMRNDTRQLNRGDRMARNDQSYGYGYASGDEGESDRESKGFAQEAKDKVSGAAHRVGDTASAVAHRVADTASDVAHRVGDTVSGAAHRVQHTAVDLAHGAGKQARRVQRRGTELFRENPLAVGAALLALGTVVGLSIPRTDTEDEWMGSARDNVMDRAQDLAHQAIGKIGEVVDDIGSDNAKSPELQGGMSSQPNGMSSRS
ncbi:MAG: DUF3618 domain-containing protein [Deltaproteobacteria bacterium]|nr:DUF3618 domain-containing protein [Deltaproteobacteria bacterium]